MPLHAHDLHPPAGAHRSRKRLGRGPGSGTGTFAGKGIKGQKARAGKDLRPGFEGGQLPLIKRMARKRGFTNPRRVEYIPINLFRLNQRFAAHAEVTPDALAAVGLLDHPTQPFKILAAGALDRPLVVRVPKISPAARAKIEAAGGRVEELHAAHAND